LSNVRAWAWAASVRMTVGWFPAKEALEDAVAAAAMVFTLREDSAYSHDTTDHLG